MNVAVTSDNSRDARDDTLDLRPVERTEALDPVSASPLTIEVERVMSGRDQGHDLARCVDADRARNGGRVRVPSSA